MLCLTTIACLAAAAAAQGPGSTNCPCASTTSWSAGATATSGGVQVLESTVGSVTTNYPITHGLDGCQSYSATNSPSCADLTTGIALVRSSPPAGLTPRVCPPLSPRSFFLTAARGPRRPTARRGARTRGATSTAPTARSRAGPSRPASSRTPSSRTRPAPPPPASPPTLMKTWPLGLA